MGRNKKRDNRGTRIFFTAVILIVIMCAGFLFKNRIMLFFDKVIAGAMIENGSDDIDDIDDIDENIPVDNKGMDDTNDDIDNGGNDNIDDDSPNHIRIDRDGEKQNKNDTGYNDDNKQPIENPDDILVLVNKTRYLDADYKPSDLVVPNVKFSFDGEHEKKNMRKEAAEALEEFFGQAHEEGIYIFALSGYRSYNTQKWLFENRANKVGEEEANKLIARPGESEHQTGLAMDITSQSVQFDLKTKFGETKEGEWVRDNAHKFGFIIRFAKDKESITGYNYEPWHIRYVGKEAAKDIYDKGIALEEYLK